LLYGGSTAITFARHERPLDRASGNRQMKRIHMPQIDARYWVGIIAASIFGTNLGDLYAHESGLGIYKGVALLAVLAAAVFLVERGDRRPKELYYWLVIIIIRTGATNIADYLAFRVRVQPALLTASLALLLALFAWRTIATSAARDAGEAEQTLPDTGAAYWLGMLSAGVFGTVVGDICSHLVGQGVASIGLDVLLAAVLVARYSAPAYALALYWVVVASARTAGTAMGDWLAENKTLNIGLPLATLLTGTTFIGVLLIWRSRRTVAIAATA
jgi:uncharacterized membrane-anchored protein